MTSHLPGVLSLPGSQLVMSGSSLVRQRVTDTILCQALCYTRNVGEPSGPQENVIF